MNLKTIRNKLFLSFLLIVVLSASMVISGYYSGSKILSYTKVVNQVDRIHLLILKMHEYHKAFLLEEGISADFYASGESANLLLALQSSDSAYQEIEAIKVHEIGENNEVIFHTSKLENQIENFKGAFEELVNLTLERGFQDWGEIGRMRDVIHDVENASLPYDRTFMLMLRRHEKDFLLRKDLKYYQRFTNGVIDFKDHILSREWQSGGGFYRESPRELLNQIDIYEQSFTRTVELEKQIGLDNQSGIRQKIYLLFSDLDSEIQTFKELTKQESENVIERNVWLFVIIFVVQLIIGVTYGIRFATQLSERVITAKHLITQLARGKIIKRYYGTVGDELTLVFEAVNRLNAMIRHAAEFAQKIGNGQTDVEYGTAFSEGVLAQSLIKMRDNLEEFKEEESRHNWDTKGMARFAQILRVTTESDEGFYDRVLSEVIRYMEMSMGALFVARYDESDEIYLHLVSAFALDQKKYKKKTMIPGEGLVGQAFVEKHPLILNKVPENYASIGTGLGASSPRSLLVIPLIYSNRVFGVLEIASFQEVPKHRIDFLVKLGGNIASSISDRQVNERTRRMLEVTQEQTEQMRAQEEEMRQNNEELRATYEEMERKEKMYLKKVSELEAQVNYFKTASMEVNEEEESLNSSN